MLDSQLIRNNKTLLRIIVFAAAVLLLLFYLVRVFDLKDDRQAEKVFHAFYSEKENSIDGIYVGTSAVYRYFMPTRAYDKYGMCIFNLATSSQPIALSKYVIEEALKTQSDSKLIIIEVRNLVKSSHYTEGDIRRITDSIKESKTRENAIKEGLEYYKNLGIDIDYNEKHYKNSFLKYHNRWTSDLTWKDFLGVKFKTRYKGFIPTRSIFESVKQDKPTEETESLQVGKYEQEALDELLEYCSTLDQEVIFVSSPYSTISEKYKELNYVSDYIEKAGFKILNFNEGKLSKDINMDYSKDFFESNHTNLKGAKKYTDYLAKYINENYDLEDHRGDSDYESWDKAIEKLKEGLVKLKEKAAEDKLLEEQGEQ